MNILNNGKNNTIILGDYCYYNNCEIRIYGNNNFIEIGPRCTLTDFTLHIEDDYNQFKVGEFTQFLGKIHLAIIEGTKISIGKSCLFSSDIHFATGDSHSILNVEGKRINKSEDIIIGNHVWVGTKVTCLKGTIVSNDSIVGATSTLCKKKFRKSNVVIAGMPGNIVKENVNWSYERVSIEK